MAQPRAKTLPLVLLLGTALCLSVAFLGRPCAAGFMDHLSKTKFCADKECTYVISMGQATGDYSAPDCRFISFRSGQSIFIYSKLKPYDGEEYWLGSVYNTQDVAQMGVLGYFPKSMIGDVHEFAPAKIKLPTNDLDFYCDS